MRELAVDGIPVVMSCRALNLARRPYYRCLRSPFTDGEHAEAYLANAIHDAHRDDPEFGYRSLADGSARTSTTRACQIGWCGGSVGTTSRGAGSGNPSAARAQSPARHPMTIWSDRDFTAAAPNQLWLTDLERHEALSNHAVVKGHRLSFVAADEQKLRAA